MRLSTKNIIRFQETILSYYKKHGRQFPWRPLSSTTGGRRRGAGELDPYGVLVLEVMLQQTQVDRVIPKYREWMRKFPTVQVLARAPLKKALLGWQGLGYNRRALYLKRAAEIIVREHGGEVPRDAAVLQSLPGVGPYTAAAVLAFAWNEPTFFVETNIRTVYLHFFFKNRKKVQDGEILKLIKQTMPNKVSESRGSTSFPIRGRTSTPCSVREWYNALMDYGAMLKKLYGNPNARSAHYAKPKKFAGSRRELRGGILRRASENGSTSPHEFLSERWDVKDTISKLVQEGFLKKQGSRFTLALVLQEKSKILTATTPHQSVLRRMVRGRVRFCHEFQAYN